MRGVLPCVRHSGMNSRLDLFGRPGVQVALFLGLQFHAEPLLILARFLPPPEIRLVTVDDELRRRINIRPVDLDNLVLGSHRDVPQGREIPCQDHHPT